MVELLIASLPLAIISATPLLLCVEGELLVQRSGVINLGVEGFLLAAAFGSAATAAATGSAAAGIAGGIVAAAAAGLLFGFFAITLKADQIVTGTALNLFVLGATSFAAREIEMRGNSEVAPTLRIDWITPFAWIVVPLLIAALLWNTTIGLRMRSAGENPMASRAAGFSPVRYRWLALSVEALLAGIAGAHLALSLSTGFAENMSAGRGFIALAVVIFGRWRVRGALAGTALFGIAAALQYAFQAASRGIPFHLLLAAPYVITLLILCGIAGRVRAPEALGRTDD